MKVHVPNWPVALVEYALAATMFVANRGLNYDLPQRFDCSGGMVWAIDPRLIVSNAHKSAGTNGPNHAGSLLVGSAMEVSSGLLWRALHSAPYAQLATMHRSSLFGGADAMEGRCLDARAFA